MHAAAAMHDDWRRTTLEHFRLLEQQRAAGDDFAAALTEQAMNDALERGYRELRRARRTAAAA